MSPSIGSRIGPYEIVEWLGAGGMGDVYRARDPRLGREVAIKLIPEAFAKDATRLNRFEQEARAAGQLNHPNILAVYDVGTEAGAPYIVSEVLEGESLRRRLRAGALTPRKAIDYARQIADGLGAAHDKGIVHRDVKPDNLFITTDGRVKILDFGIAKLTQATDPVRPTSVRTETVDGTVVGTAGYMSPEQVRGEAVDSRSDIFSVGAVLFEMLAGHPAFTRETAADTMAAILKEDATALAATVPPVLERIVSRCLEKAREARFQSARDLGFALDVLSGTATTAEPVPAIPRSLWLRQRASPWIVSGALALALALVLMLWAPWRKAVPAPAPLRLSAELGAGMSLANSINSTFGHSISISPHGDVVAFAAEKGAGEVPQLYVRRLDQLQVVSLPGTDGASSPFFAPDGLWIAFFAGGKLKKIAVTGGAPEALANAPNPRGGAWGEDGTIVFSPEKTAGTRLLRVSAAGGTAAPLASLSEGEVIQTWPQVLPGGRGVLYTGSSVPGAYNDANLMVQPLPGGTPKVVYRGGYHGRYLPSGLRSSTRAEREGGHLIYVRDGTLYAVPFDLDRLEVTGPSVHAIEGVTSNAITGGAQLAVSANGSLVYRPGQSGAALQLHLMDREGKTTPLPVAPANLFNLVFAPDGRLAMEIREGPPNVWVYEAGNKLRSLTSDPVRAAKPAWTSDSRRIAFASARGDKSTLNLWWQRADGTGEVQRLTTSQHSQLPGSWHKSGRFLAFEQQDPQTSSDVMILPMEGDDASGWAPGTPTVFVNSTAVEIDPAFSPDGRWLAYSSNQSGRMEVYVRPFPGSGSMPQRISTDGGSVPTWSRTKNELFYAHGIEGHIMTVAYALEGNALRPEQPRLWSEGRYQVRGPNRMFDLHPDGERFALAPAAPMPGNHVTFIFNFFEELRRIAPATSR
jgi:serine/threonine protein kinase/Tol biopolymer transport system component